LVSKPSPLTERLLQYIWQFQYFNRGNLATSDGAPLSIINAGTLNRNQGPDFLEARIRVAGTVWAGSIELHLLSSDWNNHQHSQDKNFDNVILHVVWQEDVALKLPFPSLELQSKVSKPLLSRFDELMNAQSFIACEKRIAGVAPLVWLAWKDRLLLERLEQKAALIIQCLGLNSNHWEETFWWLIARNFGFTVNSDAFEKIARSLPLTILARHRNQVQQAEAMIFGQAGLLDAEFTEAYPRLLQKEYRFYKNKYGLQPIRLPLHFLRMRPSNFPTLRLAQLAMLVHNSTHLFSQIKEAGQLRQVRALLDIRANDYWHYHYNFDHLTAYREKKLGKQMVDSIIINTIVPIVFAYGRHFKEPLLQKKAVDWLEEVAGEKNRVTAGFRALGISSKNACDSQALIELKSRYCDQKRCLECAVGNQLLWPKP
jgi:hypothetical protein